MDRTAAFYSGPSYVFGAGAMPVFSGARRQRGGSIFGSIKNFVLPIFKSLGAKIAKRGAKEAIGLAKDVVSGALKPDSSAKETFLNRGKKRALSLTRYAADEGLDTLDKMVGSGRKRICRRRRQSRSLRKRKRSTKRVKRKRSVKRVKRSRKSVKRKRRTRTKRRRTAKSLF